MPTFNLTSAVARGPKTVRVTFSASPDSGTVLPGNFTLTAENDDTTPAVDLEVEAAELVEAGSLSVDLTTDVPMTPGAPYLVHAVNVEAGGHTLTLDPANDEATFDGFTPDSAPLRSFQLWEMLPRKNRDEDVTGDLRRFVNCLQEVVDLLLAEYDRFPELLDPDLMPAAALDVALGHLGNPFAFALDESQQRKLVANLVELYRENGTDKGIIDCLRLLLGIEFTIVGYWANAVASMALGVSELDVDFKLAPPAGSRERWTFDVISPSPLSEAQALVVRQVVAYMRRAGTHLGRVLVQQRRVTEPGDPRITEHGDTRVTVAEA